MNNSGLSRVALSPGFKRYELRERYDVSEIHEDEWHTFGDQKRAQLIRRAIQHVPKGSGWLLNAGAGVHALNLNGWHEVAVDIFSSPIFRHRLGICANIAALPFRPAQFGLTVCVGEVLGYCDPAQAISEFARVLAPGGLLLCDFGNTRSARYWLTPFYGRAAELTTMDYNGRPERIWIYDPSFIRSVLKHYGFYVLTLAGVYRLAALLQRMGVSAEGAVRAEQRLASIPFPGIYSDVLFIAAKRVSASKQLR